MMKFLIFSSVQFSALASYTIRFFMKHMVTQYLSIEHQCTV